MIVAQIGATCDNILSGGRSPVSGESDRSGRPAFSQLNIVMENFKSEGGSVIAKIVIGDHPISGRGAVFQPGEIVEAAVFGEYLTCLIDEGAVAWITPVDDIGDPITVRPARTTAPSFEDQTKKYQVH